MANPVSTSDGRSAGGNVTVNSPGVVAVVVVGVCVVLGIVAYIVTRGGK